MNLCKICGKSLYKNITFSNMFKCNYVVHKDCLQSLDFNHDEEVIPIESNIIIYDYVFTYLNNDFELEYLWYMYFNIAIEKHLKNKEWSIMIIYDMNLEIFLKEYNPYLLINLTNNPLLFISLKKREHLYLEDL